MPTSEKFRNETKVHGNCQCKRNQKDPKRPRNYRRSPSGQRLPTKNEPMNFETKRSTPMQPWIRTPLIRNQLDWQQHPTGWSSTGWPRPVREVAMSWQNDAEILSDRWNSFLSSNNPGELIVIELLAMGQFHGSRMRWMALESKHE